MSENRKYTDFKGNSDYEYDGTLQRNTLLWDDGAGDKIFEGINTALYVERRWIVKICSWYACQPQLGAKITQPVSQVLAMSFSVVFNITDMVKNTSGQWSYWF